MEQENNIKQNEVNVHPKKVKHKGKIRRRVVLLFILLVFIIGYISFRGQFLEISEIGTNYEGVFWKNVTYKSITLGINFIVLFIILCITNNSIKKGLKKFFEDEKKEMPKLPNKSIALVLSIVVSALMVNILAQKSMLMFNSAWFGINDPIFNMDIGYFMFQKPFIETILFYLAFIMVGLIVYTGIYYVAVFNIYFDGVNRETLKQSKLIKQIIFYIKIVTIIIAAIVLVKTQDIEFDKLLTLKDEESTAIYGAGLTDVTIKLWGYRILSIIIIVSVFMAIKYFKRRNTKKVIYSLVAVPTYLVLLFVIMTAFQLIFVNPNELDKEKQYIAYNIENTKNAYNINIEEKNIENTGTIELDQIQKNTEVLSNIAIVNEDVTLKTLKDKQSNSKYYTYNSTQIQKYNIDGKDKLVYVSPREIASQSDVTYNNKTYEYTHGFGDVITSAVSTDEFGNVEYIQKTFDGTDEKINISQPRIYFGMETNQNVVTNSKNKSEYDYPTSESENAENTYDGQAGLKLGFIDRLIISVKQGNMKLAFSSEVTKDSKILINRNIIKRAKSILPYVIYDEEPYQVITDDGKLVWVIDGYTVSNKYPYSQSAIIEVNGTKQRINYIRNSVKVLVDSYDGTVKFYITDRTDPIIMAYRNIYPTLFQDIDTSIPEDIAKHIVYPKFLYTIQSEMLERYHNVKTDVLYRSNDVWDVATHTTSKTLKTTGTPITPYYTMLNTIDSDESTLGLVLPYTPYEKQNLISYLVGTCDNSGNGKLTLYKFSADSNVLGPMQLDTQIEQDEEISKTIQSLSVTGTKLIRDMIIVPIDNTLLYVEPIYQVKLNESEIPILKKIVVASGNKVAIGDNLIEALENLGSQYAINIEIENTDNLNDLVEEIVKANKNLHTSTSNNDWEMIGKDMDNLQELVDKLEVLLDEQKKEEEKEGKNTNGSDNTNVTDENVTNELNNLQ